MIPLPTVFPLRTYRQRTAGSGLWKMSGGEYDKLPHMLIAGGTGGGKTYFILTLIEALLRTNAVLFVLDPKNADLADFQAVMPDVLQKGRYARLH